MLMHREIEGKIKQVTIKHASSGKWYACIVADIEQAHPPNPPSPDKKVGIDVGLLHFAADSHGTLTGKPQASCKVPSKAQKAPTATVQKEERLKEQKQSAPQGCAHSRESR